MPRIKKHLRKLLQNEALKPVRAWAEKGEPDMTNISGTAA